MQRFCVILAILAGLAGFLFPPVWLVAIGLFLAAHFQRPVARIRPAHSHAVKTCSACGSKNRADSLACNTCGSPV